MYCKEREGHVVIREGKGRSCSYKGREGHVVIREGKVMLLL